MNRPNKLRSRTAQFLSFCFHPVMLLAATIGTNYFRVRALFLSAAQARDAALRFDFQAVSLGIEQPLRSCASYQRAVIAAKRTGNSALLLQTLSYAAHHYFACQHLRKARRAAKWALILAAARCGEPLKNDSRHYEDETMQSLVALVRECDWLIKGKEARSCEQSGESCLSENKYMQAATMFRMAAESASIAIGGDALPVGLLYGRQGDALLAYHQYAQAARVLRAANNIVCEWLEPGNQQRQKITDNLALAIRSVVTAADESDPRANKKRDDDQLGYGGVWPYYPI